jgi:heptaprenylglyceryl phosphate synthase
VVVSMMIVMLELGIEAGIDNGMVGTGIDDGTVLTETVVRLLADKMVTGELIDENETELGISLNEITARLGADETTI